MSAPRQLPEMSRMERWKREGLTYRQMAERHFEETGIRVTDRAFSAAFSRAGKSGESKPLARTVPWRVRTDHHSSYPLTMLRALGRRLRNEPLRPGVDEELNQWLKKLRARGLIVGYDSRSDAGFHYIDKALLDHFDLQVPIRIGEVRSRPSEPHTEAVAASCGTCGVTGSARRVVVVEGSQASSAWAVNLCPNCFHSALSQVKASSFPVKMPTARRRHAMTQTDVELRHA